MKVKDLIPMEVDVDVYDDCCEACQIAFCGPMKLTENGEKRWAKVLEHEISFFGDCTAIVHADDEDDADEVAAFFNAAAGYCSVSDYDAWFDETD